MTEMRGSFCIDYPACGHHAEDPCEEQWYDTPEGKDYIYKHALCDHEAGDCYLDDE